MHNTHLGNPFHIILEVINHITILTGTVIHIMSNSKEGGGE